MKADPLPAASQSAETLPESVDFDSFFISEYSALVRLAWVLTGRLDLAEEHVQEAFLNAHKRWERVGRLDLPGAWMRRVVTNRCISTARSRLTEARLLARLGNRPVHVVEMPREADDVWTAVRRLPKRQAQVVALIYCEDRGISEVAEILGCSESTARTHLRRGRLALAKSMNLEDEDAVKR